MNIVQLYYLQHEIWCLYFILTVGSNPNRNLKENEMNASAYKLGRPAGWPPYRGECDAH